jgi:hypothetical protein
LQSTTDSRGRLKAAITPALSGIWTSTVNILKPIRRIVIVFAPIGAALTRATPVLSVNAPILRENATLAPLTGRLVV